MRKKAARKEHANPTLRVLGWTLIVAAVAMHFSAIEWRIEGSHSQIFLFLHAREQFKLIPDNAYSGPYDVMKAGFFGLVVPVLIAGQGIIALQRAKSKGMEAASAPEAPQTCDLSPPPAHGRFRPCPDCDRAVSRKATSCPICGCPLVPEETCTDCQQLVSKDDVRCPTCGCPLKQERKAPTEPPESPGSEAATPPGL